MFTSERAKLVVLAHVESGFLDARTIQADWTSQQARNFQMHIDDHGLNCGILCRDNDTK